MSTSSPTGIPSSSNINQVESLDAFNSVREEMNALERPDLEHINVDMAGAAIAALARIPKLQALRSEIALLPGVDISKFDRLETWHWGAPHGMSGIGMPDMGGGESLGKKEPSRGALSDDEHNDRTVIILGR